MSADKKAAKKKRIDKSKASTTPKSKQKVAFGRTKMPNKIKKKTGRA